jgi:hypothetical protein
MLYPRAHAWTSLQKWLIIAGTILAALVLSILVYRYGRSPDQRVLVGTWEGQTDDGRSQYTFKADSTFEVVDPDAPYGPRTFAHGRWYAGGKFVYLRFQIKEPWDRELLIWQIDDISSEHLQIHVARNGPVHAFTRVVHGSPKASNQALEPTADRSENLLLMTSIRKTEAQLAVVSGGSAWSR